MNVLDLANYDQFVGMFVGKSGSGKTGALGSFAKADLEKGKKTLIFDVDKRARGLLGLRKIFEDKVLANIEVEQNLNPINGFKELDSKLERLIILQKANQLRYGTIVFESIYTLQRMFLYDAMALRGADKAAAKVRVRGAVKYIDPQDYLYTSLALHQLIYEVVPQLKCNIIFTAWIVNEWGKPKNSGNEYANNEIVGQKILATDKVSEEIPGCFDEIYRFEKEETGLPDRPLNFTVSFEDSLAKTSRSELRGRGKIDITNKMFYDVYQSIINGTYKK